MKKLFPFLMLFLSLSTAKAQTTADYIAANAPRAQALMREHQLPASIILAVAIHESAAGTSKIARYLNNHFGIKGRNSSKAIRSAYRDYPSVDSSYTHFVDFLHSRPYFEALFDRYNPWDFTGWARGIQRAGYARSQPWARQVIALIHKYELFRYDERPGGDPTAITASADAAHEKKWYTVKSGDNLNRIAKKFDTSVTALMEANGLSSALLQPGQQLLL